MSDSVPAHAVERLNEPLVTVFSKWLWLVLLACIALLPFEPFFNVPTVLMALVGIYILVIGGRSIWALSSLATFTLATPDTDSGIPPFE